jgi:dihydroflavonol-4-reductase
MRIYVTGGSGFVGGHVVRQLVDAGADVRAERVDLLDRQALDRLIRGCDAVVHAAALYSYDASAADHELVNVEGTRLLLDVCATRGVRRLVHTSTAGTCGPAEGRVADERDSPPSWELTVPYKRTKLAAERLVLDACRSGLETVVVNPTTPVGEGDRKPTPTGAMVWGVARGRIRGFVAGCGLNVVDVRDVARGHVLALERGRAGQRYLLGGVNLPLDELFALIANLAGRPQPRVRVPYAVARGAGACGLVNRHEVRLARLPMFFSSRKAERELGYRAGPIEPALERAVAEALARPCESRLLGYVSSVRERRRAASASAEPAMPSRT